MTIIPTEFEGLYVLEPKVFSDTRGYFFESYSKKELAKLIPHIEFVQDNESCSTKGVIRGLHFQLPPFSQAKLVRCVKGCVKDVAVDLRKGSPTFGKYFNILLSEENKKQLFIPHGFAHGFEVLSDSAIFLYKCDAFYNPDAEDGINLFDPDINIDWSTNLQDAIISAKDLRNKNLLDFDSPFEFNIS